MKTTTTAEWRADRDQARRACTDMHKQARGVSALLADAGHQALRGEVAAVEDVAAMLLKQVEAFVTAARWAARERRTLLRHTLPCEDD
jgi:hypothetical protein